MFTTANSIDILSTWRKFTDTAVIKIPKAIYYMDGDQRRPVTHIGEFFKTGDPVKIELGYNRKLATRFEGYIARSPKPSIPYELECEDEMWQLKRKEATVHIEDATVRQILEEAAPGYEIDCPDEFFGDFSMAETTPVKIFDELRKRAGLYTFFRGKRLVCGLPHSDPKLPETVANMLFGKNVISSTLQYRQRDDVKVKIYANSIQTNGTVIRVEVGEDGGDIERWNMPPNLTKDQIEKQAKLRLQNYKNAGGYTGDVKTFGWPNVQHGQKMRIVDRGVYEERDSTHFIDEVKITVTPDGGYKQVIKVGRNAGTD